MLELNSFARDFSAAIMAADARRPIAFNARSKEAFKAGIGPHSEANTVDLVLGELISINPEAYQGRIWAGVPYPENSRQRCDVCIGCDAPWEWAIEIKMLRLLGDNGQVNDNILMHILSPYPAHRSAVTDCSKLLRFSSARRKAILIFGYESEDWPLEPAITAFEALAARMVRLSGRGQYPLVDLVHTVHSRGFVYAWEVIN